MWSMTFFTIKGVDWIIVSGPNMLPKEERQAYKEKHDMIAMNRFIGKRILLPLSVWGSVLIPSIFLSPEFTAYYIFIGAVAGIAMVLIFSAVPKLFGNHFEKK
jgi:hypothetical protein